MHAWGTHLCSQMGRTMFISMNGRGGTTPLLVEDLLADAEGLRWCEGAVAGITGCVPCNTRVHDCFHATLTQLCFCRTQFLANGLRANHAHDCTSANSARPFGWSAAAGANLSMGQTLAAVGVQHMHMARDKAHIHRGTLRHRAAARSPPCPMCYMHTLAAMPQNRNAAQAHTRMLVRQRTP